jgi:hypothetical protein
MWALWHAHQMEEPLFTPRPSPWILLAIAAVLLVTLLFGLDHRMIRVGGLLGLAGVFLAILGVWLATKKRRS